MALRPAMSRLPSLVLGAVGRRRQHIPLVNTMRSRSKLLESESYQMYRREFPHAAILMQVGAFYEMLGQDVARIERSNIPLKVSRNALAGFPIDALDNWLPLIFEEFKRVVIVQEVVLYLDVQGSGNLY